MEVEEALRRAGYGSILALGVFLFGLVLANLILSVVVPAYRLSSEASDSAKEFHEKKREGLRVFVWSYYFPAPGRGMRWQQPYIFISVEGGYAVRIREILVLEAENRSAIDPITGRLVSRYSIDRVVEPPCLMIRLRSLDNRWRTLAAFNASASHVAIITWEGKTYYGAVRMPEATLAYPCAPDPDRNAFDLHIIVTPDAAGDHVSWGVLKGTCGAEQRGNQLKLTCSAYAVVRLNATDGAGYAFQGWNVEGVTIDDRVLTLILDTDYSVNVMFRRS